MQGGQHIWSLLQISIVEKSMFFLWWFLRNKDEDRFFFIPKNFSNFSTQRLSNVFSVYRAMHFFWCSDLIRLLNVRVKKKYKSLLLSLSDDSIAAGKFFLGGNYSYEAAILTINVLSCSSFSKVRICCVPSFYTTVPWIPLGFGLILKHKQDIFWHHLLSVFWHRLIIIKQIPSRIET